MTQVSVANVKKTSLNVLFRLRTYLMTYILEMSYVLHILLCYAVLLSPAGVCVLFRSDGRSSFGVEEA